HAFEIALPAGYPLAHLKRALGRDPHSLTERLDGDTYTAAVRTGPDQTPALLRLRFAGDRIQVSTTPPRAPEAHAMVVALLGLDQDAPAFARLARKLGLARLVAGTEQLRLPQTPSVFDGLLWAIIGQQINLPFAFQLRRRLTELTSTPFADGLHAPPPPAAGAAPSPEGHKPPPFSPPQAGRLWAIIGQQINLPFAFQLRRRLTELTGTPFADGLHAPPTPAAVAALSPEDLKPLQFSRAKAACVIDTARLVATGRLDLDALRAMSATRVERTLLAIRGLGPWSVNYLMMRSLGFADCVPLGDTGVTSGLRTLFDLDERPDTDATKRLMAVFAPHRSLATAHLWQLHQPAPDQ